MGQSESKASRDRGQGDEKAVAQPRDTAVPEPSLSNEPAATGGPASSTVSEPATNTIDYDLYSRQVYVLGARAMAGMAQSNVLIVGLKGLGCEIAKNLILAGVKSVTLHDREPVQIADLSTQFFLHEDNVGTPRAAACLPRLAELNNYVPISLLDGELATEATLKRFQVVLLTDAPLSVQLAVNAITHPLGIRFVAADTRGLFGMCFNDFGEDFHVHDADGEEPVSGIVAAIERDGTVACLDERRHGLVDGDYVTFSEVRGLEGLNGTDKQWKVAVTGPYTFKIDETSSFGDYEGGGIFTQVKQGKTIKMLPLKEAINNPKFVISDFAKFERPAQLHLGFQALDEFRSKHGRLPKPRSASDADEVSAIARELNKSAPQPVDTIDEDVLRELSYQAAGDTAPMNAVIGGLVAQEVLKACSGKFTPLDQYFYFDALEALPQGTTLTEDQCAPRGDRYDGQVAVFGREFQEKVRAARQFLVGAGAIGCEMLKNWALMGLGTGEEGQLFVTDMDTIERSNLNRQFLFRSKDIGNLKSESAVKAVMVMNPDLKGKVKFYAERVGRDTERVFDDEFWSKLSGVTNALDNVEARRYVDSRCVFYRKPLLESGTLGTKGNTQVVLPFLTETYSSSADPPEKSIPVCTLKNFPNQIEHTIQWARDLFEGLFHNPAENINAYLTQADYVEKTLKQGNSNEQKEIFEGIRAGLAEDRPKSFEDCVAWARVSYEKYFVNTIRQMLYNFPEDAVNSQGVPFWSGPKRAPRVIAFDAEEPAHLDFIVAAANIYAYVYGIEGTRDREIIKAAVEKVTPPAFTPKSGVAIEVTDAEVTEKEFAAVDEDELTTLAKVLPPRADFLNLSLRPASFEKDDDTNFHIDFITAASNLRALNYQITPTDRHKTKFVAGKIIPAIATTTALVAGLVNLELFKLLDGRTTIDSFKNGFVNLALPFVGFSEPIAAPKKKYYDVEWTLWDRIEVDGGDGMTLEGFLAYMKEKNRMEVSMLSAGTTSLFTFFMSAASKKERMGMKIPELYEKVSTKTIEPHVRSLVLEALVNDEDGEDSTQPSEDLYPTSLVTAMDAVDAPVNELIKNATKQI
ncbi:hypothetical protein HK101_002132 [Irineochytrium annulatum]|nr:hypothetical protein HK101_002132 [Irineochytrium annulatum]